MHRRRFRKQNALETDQGTINLTPLIDVVFVVLIMFILIAPMLEIDKVHLASGPHSEQKEGAAPSPLSIHVREDNTLLVNKHLIEEENLPILLKALYQKNSELTPQLYQDRKAYFGTYQKVKNALEEAGFKELDVVLEPSQ